MLAEELNHRPGTQNCKWHYINKEIVEQAAKELELEPSKIQHLFSMDRIGMMDDIFSSFSANYKSTLKIRKTIRDVIQSFTGRGFVIIVGRGSVAITQGRPDSLHIRLHAPLDWRVQCVSEHKGLTLEEARKVAIETDFKRSALIESFLGHKFDIGLFDASFNCKTISNDQIVNTIIKMMEDRKMI